MKKLFLVFMIAIVAIGFVFADEAKSIDEVFDYGQIHIGGSIGYVPELQSMQLDATARWRLDYTDIPFFTTDLVASTGILTNFKEFTAFDGFFGVGFSKYIANYWNLMASVGLDMIASSSMFELGVAGSVGCEFFATNDIAVNLNFKLAKYVKSNTFTFKPSLGVTYAF